LKRNYRAKTTISPNSSKTSKKHNENKP
jgi:hypothetical protein